MNAWQLILRDLRSWLHRKRLFAMDVEDFETLHLVAERQRRPPEEVAAQVGYTDPFHFSRLFRNVVGTNPTEYRRKRMRG